MGYTCFSALWAWGTWPELSSASHTAVFSWGSRAPRSVWGWISHHYTWPFLYHYLPANWMILFLSQIVHWVSPWNTSHVEFLKGPKPYTKARNFNESVSRVAGIGERESGIWITMSLQDAGRYWTDKMIGYPGLAFQYFWGMRKANGWE